jgi:hypothetical protein
MGATDVQNVLSRLGLQFDFNDRYVQELLTDLASMTEEELEGIFFQHYLEQLSEMLGDFNRYCATQNLHVSPEVFPKEGLSGEDLLKKFNADREYFGDMAEEEIRKMFFDSLDTLLVAHYRIKGGCADFRRRHPVD